MRPGTKPRVAGGGGARGGSHVPDTGRQGRGGSLPGWGDLAGLHPAPRQRPPFSGQDRTGSPTRHPLQAPLCPLPRPARPPLPPGGAGVGDRPDRGLEAIGADPRSPRLGAASRHHTQNPALPRGLRGPGPGCPTPGPGCPADIRRLVGLDPPLPQSSWPPTSVRTGPHPPLHRTWLCLPPAPTPAPLTAGLTPPQGRRPRAPGLLRTSAGQPPPACSPTYPGRGHHHCRPRAPVILGAGVRGSGGAPALTSQDTGGSSGPHLPGHRAVPAPRCLAPWANGHTGLCWGRGDKGRLTTGARD